MNALHKLPDLKPLPWPSDLLDSVVGSAHKFSLDGVMNSLTRRPADNYFGLIAVCTLVFYQAEKGHNPKVNDIWDALVYCTTCCSVGYADIFARTAAGKVVGSLLMTLGPAMAAKALDGRESPDETQRQILAKLEELCAGIANYRPAQT